jgi:hypothetical protein
VYVLCVEACTPSDDPTGECGGLKEGEYKIVHASGLNDVCYFRGTQKQTCTDFFDRKTIIHKIIPMSNMTGGLDSPLGFGRIKLWE